MLTQGRPSVVTIHQGDEVWNNIDDENVMDQSQLDEDPDTF